MEEKNYRDEELLPSDEQIDKEESPFTEQSSVPEVTEQKKRRGGKEGKPFLAELYDWIEIFAISIAAVFVIFAFVARVAVVDGSSMANTLHHGDKLIVSNFMYTPKQGDIIVCQTEFFGFEEPIVKRIIATEGQVVRIDTESWTVYVDGAPLEENYVLRVGDVAMNGFEGYGEGGYIVPEGHVFVMGDNRNGSWDSRDAKVGPVDIRYIVGKVIFRFAPSSVIGPVD